LKIIQEMAESYHEKSPEERKQAQQEHARRLFMAMKQNADRASVNASRQNREIVIPEEGLKLGLTDPSRFSPAQKHAMMAAFAQKITDDAAHPKTELFLSPEERQSKPRVTDGYTFSYEDSVLGPVGGKQFDAETNKRLYQEEYVRQLNSQKEFSQPDHVDQGEEFVNPYHLGRRYSSERMAVDVSNLDTEGESGGNSPNYRRGSAVFDAPQSPEAVAASRRMQQQRLHSKITMDRDTQEIATERMSQREHKKEKGALGGHRDALDSVDMAAAAFEQGSGFWEGRAKEGKARHTSFSSLSLGKGSIFSEDEARQMKLEQQQDYFKQLTVAANAAPIAQDRASLHGRRGSSSNGADSPPQRRNSGIIANIVAAELENPATALARKRQSQEHFVNQLKEAEKWKAELDYQESLLANGGAVSPSRKQLKPKYPKQDDIDCFGNLSRSDSVDGLMLPSHAKDNSQSAQRARQLEYAQALQADSAASPIPQNRASRRRY
jgi:hypothetical protein